MTRRRSESAHEKGPPSRAALSSYRSPSRPAGRTYSIRGKRSTSEVEQHVRGTDHGGREAERERTDHPVRKRLHHPHLSKSSIHIQSKRSSPMPVRRDGERKNKA
ncbi:hypothetical protein Mext_1779 [Methylorubrum extorquens PA1]|nr:hypothetical protein Mext_1779 [Methylorubrum extorquens PA1]